MNNKTIQDLCLSHAHPEIINDAIMEAWPVTIYQVVGRTSGEHIRRDLDLHWVVRCFRDRLTAECFRDRLNLWCRGHNLHQSWVTWTRNKTCTLDPHFRVGEYGTQYEVRESELL